MSQRHYYRDATDTLVEQSDRVPQQGWAVQDNAEEGTVGSSRISLDDADMDQEYVAHREWTVIEDESESDDDVLWTGFVGAQDVSRGLDADSRLTLGRVWTLELYDINTLWSRRVERGGKRPAETDVARVQWVLASGELAPVLSGGDVTTYVDTSSPVGMSKANYTGQTINSIMDDCAQQSGKNWFFRVISDGVDRVLCAFYGNYTYDSPLLLSNDRADWDLAAIVDGSALYWPIGKRTNLRRDGSRVFTGAFGEWEKGRLYRHRASTATAFGMRRDMVVPMPDARSVNAARTRLEKALDLAATQDERITTEVVLPNAKATMLKAGMRVYFKATHLPGYDDWVRVRILNAIPTPIAGGNKYRIALELQGPGVGALSCSAALAASTSNVASDTAGIITTASVSITAPDTGYVVGILHANNGNTPAATAMGLPSGFTNLDNHDLLHSTWRISYKAVSAGSTTMSASFTPGFSTAQTWIGDIAYLPWAGLTVVQSASPLPASPAGGGSVSFATPPTPGNTILMFAESEDNRAITMAPGGTSGQPSTGWTELFLDSTALAGNSRSHVGCWARCVESGDGSIYGFTYSGAVLGQACVFIVEIAT